MISLCHVGLTHMGRNTRLSWIRKKTVPSLILFVRFGFEAMARKEWSVDIPSFVVAMHMQVVIVGAKFVLGERTLRYAC